MRILHVLPSLSPLTGGPAHSVPALCAALAGRGHEVRLLGTDWLPPGAGGDNPAFSQPAGVTVECHRAERSTYAPGLPHSNDLLRSLVRQAGGYDLVHVHSLWNPVASHAMRCLRQGKRLYFLSPRGMLDPVVLSRHAWRKRAWAALVERANVAQAHCVHFTSPGERERAMASAWPIRRSIICANILGFAAVGGRSNEIGADSTGETYSGVGHPAWCERGPLVLFVGRLSWVKNLDVLVDAFALLRRVNPSAQLALVGPDSENLQTQLEARACSLGVADGVHFPGFMTRSELAPIYAHAAASVLISQKENFGLAAAEALWHGVPLVLGSDVQLDIKDQAPLVARVRVDAKTIADALEAMLIAARDTDLRGQARSLASSTWNDGISTATLVAAYEQARRHGHGGQG